MGTRQEYRHCDGGRGGVESVIGRWEGGGRKPLETCIGINTQIYPAVTARGRGSWIARRLLNGVLFNNASLGNAAQKPIRPPMRRQRLSCAADARVLHVAAGVVRLDLRVDHQLTLAAPVLLPREGGDAVQVRRGVLAREQAIPSCSAYAPRNRSSSTSNTRGRGRAHRRAKASQNRFTSGLRRFHRSWVNYGRRMAKMPGRHTRGSLKPLWQGKDSLRQRVRHLPPPWPGRGDHHFRAFIQPRTRIVQRAHGGRVGNAGRLPVHSFQQVPENAAMSWMSRSGSSSLAR